MAPQELEERAKKAMQAAVVRNYFYQEFMETQTEPKYMPGKPHPLCRQTYVFDEHQLAVLPPEGKTIAVDRSYQGTNGDNATRRKIHNMFENIFPRHSPRATFSATSLSLALLICVTMIIPTGAAAQTDNHRRPQRVAQKADNDTTRSELEQFDRFLDANPGIAKEISKNPSLIDDQKYVNSHRSLAAFLRNHPKVREEMREHPQAFMEREKRFQSLEGPEPVGPITEEELRHFDGFLDRHPQIATDLERNPKLVDDQSYLNNHPELKDWLSHHQSVREELKANPQAFIAREEAREKQEKH